jgi:hypothetical protein
MTQRRSLIDRMNENPPVIDPAKEKEFVLAGTVKRPEPPARATVPQPTVPSRVPISTRMRGDFAAALKRASLERQLGGIEPHTLTDILEQAVEPWLRTNGYLT